MSPWVVDTVDDLTKGNSAAIKENDVSSMENMPAFRGVQYRRVLPVTRTTNV